MSIRLIGTIALLGLATSWCHGQAPFTATSNDPGDSSQSYLSQRAALTTNLLKKGKSPHRADEPKPLPGYRKVFYTSGNLRLKAWLYVPPGITRPRPGIVHFHGGFGLSHGHFHTAKPFQRAGFVVMIPALRAENGNPGIFEMWLSEVDDAAAAVKWLHGQRFVDSKHVYAFGHSSGGVVSAMLSLFGDVPLRHSGSSGGLYNANLFYALRDRVPFDLSDEKERQLRVLPGNVRWMKRKHYAFYGSTDTGLLPSVQAAQEEIQGKKSYLEITEVPGNHNESLTPAMEKYLEIIKQDFK